MPDLIRIVLSMLVVVFSATTVVNIIRARRNRRIAQANYLKAVVVLQEAAEIRRGARVDRISGAPSRLPENRGS